MMRLGWVNDRPHLELDFWELNEFLGWPMPFFPLTGIILLTLAFYFDFLSLIFPKLCTLKILQFCTYRLLPYFHQLR